MVTQADHITRRVQGGEELMLRGTGPKMMSKSLYDSESRTSPEPHAPSWSFISRSGSSACLTEWKPAESGQVYVKPAPQRSARRVLRRPEEGGDRKETALQTDRARTNMSKQLLKRPELEYSDIANLKGSATSDSQAAEQVAIQAKYAGYIDRQREDIERLRRYENTRLPEDIDYAAVGGLSNEVKQKLTEARPETLARAGRVPGVTPAGN